MKTYYVGLLRPLPERWREDIMFIATSKEKIPPRAMFVREVRAPDRAHAAFELGKIVGKHHGIAERVTAPRRGRRKVAA